jgi:site-specific recombinase XerD
MKETIINEIVRTLHEMGIDTDGVTERLYLIFKDVEVSKAETALAVRDDMQNETLLRQFLAAKAVKGCTKNTIRAYGNTLRYIFKRFSKTVTAWTPEDIRVYTAYRLTQDHISKSFANTEIRFLRTFFAWLQNEEIIQRNPMNKIDSVKMQKIKKKAFTDIEVEKIREACRTPMETAMIETFLSTGCRVSEVAAIQIAEINDDKVLVHGKGNKDRVVYLNAKSQIAIAKYLSERSDTNPYLFPAGVWINYNSKRENAQNPFWYQNPELVGEGIRDKSSFGAILRRIGKKAGVENVHPHRFRRTCATMALRRGMPLELVSKMLGHEQIATTQIYLDLSEHELEEAHKKYVV